MNKIKINQITLLAILLSILFIQEQILSFLPNIQLTIMLMIVYVKFLGWQKSSIIIIMHVILDGLFMGAMNPIFIIFNILGYLFIPLCLTIFNKWFATTFKLALFGILASLFYSWINIIPSIIILDIDFIHYLMADILFELLLAGSSFLTILWLYEPLIRTLTIIDNQNKLKKQV